MLKKTLKRSLLVFFILIALVFMAPFLFRNQLIQLVKSEINHRVNARVEFGELTLSFFRQFPKVSIRIEKISVTGRGEFSTDTLMAADQLEASVNFMSLIRGAQYQIHSIEIDQPRIHAVVHKNGHTNWNISFPDTTTVQPTTPVKFQLRLDKYAIHRGYISYRDEAGDRSGEICNLEHQGSGDVNSTLFTLSTKTSADAFSFNDAGIPFFNRAKTIIDADIQVDNHSGRYTFKTDKVSINDLQLHTQGYFQLMNDSVYQMDIQYNAPSTDFKKILSLVPAIYRKDFSSIKTSGSALVSGFIKGTYSASEMPAYALNLEVKNGFFQYPDLPLPVKNINLSLHIENPDGITDHMVIDLPQAHLEMNQEPFDMHLKVQHPVSNMYIDAAIKGNMDLSALSKLVKLENTTRLGGLLHADVKANGLVSAIKKQETSQFSATGKVRVENFYYSSKEYPDGVSLNVLDALVNTDHIYLSQLEGNYLHTNFKASGTIENWCAYMLKNQPLAGLINVQADKMNLNEWMGTSTGLDSQAVAPSPFLVPGRLNLEVRSHIDKATYEKVELDHLSGIMLVKDETVYLKDIHADALGGTMNINGSYSTRTDQKKPDISLTYEVQNLDVQKTFYAFNTVQKLMPVGQFLSGKLTSTLSMTGKLGADMMPDLSTLSGNGSLILIEGFLQKFAPVEQLAASLHIEQLENIALRDVHNYITFNHGKVQVQPFHLLVKGIQMDISGSHGFDQSLDYIIHMKVPRSLIGAQGNKVIDQLISRVNNQGIPLNAGEMISLKVNMGGFVLHPEIKTSWQQMAGDVAADLKHQATELARSKLDTARKIIQDSLHSMKRQAIAGMRETLVKKLSGASDSTGTTAPVIANDLRRKAGETGKEIMKNLFGKKKKEKDPSQ